MTDFVNTPVLVELQPVNGEAQPVTTSLRVAEYFGKNHYHVMRDVKDILAKCSESFNASNFGLVDYVDQKGEKRPMYLLTRDGFTMVAMGYTGEKAMQFKEAYINASNFGLVDYVDNLFQGRKRIDDSASHADPRPGFDRGGGFSYCCTTTMEADCGTIHI